MVVNVRMEKELVRLLAEQVAKEGTTRSQLIRQAVIVYLARMGK